jgi:hypothetical protein
MLEAYLGEVCDVQWWLLLHAKLQVDVCEFENDAKTARILLARMEAMMDTLPWPNQPIQL